jgi:hypothetical protein
MKIKTVEQYKNKIDKRMRKRVNGSEGVNYYSALRSKLVEEASKIRFYMEVYPDQDMINEERAYTLLQKEYTRLMNEYKTA